jgi:metal-sulfur cluster biosynthetic enzyme
MIKSTMEFEEKRQEIAKGLRDVIDPEIGMNIVDVGLIYGIEIDSENKVTIKMSLTTPGCPLSDYFLSEIETKMMDIDFVEDVEILFVWVPKWDIIMMDEVAKQEMFSSMRN